jgi:hypothetical protein
MINDLIQRYEHLLISPFQNNPYYTEEEFKNVVKEKIKELKEILGKGLDV